MRSSPSFPTARRSGRAAFSLGVSAAALLLTASLHAQDTVSARVTGVFVDAGSSVILTGPDLAGGPFRWQHDGTDLLPIGYSLRIDDLQPGHAGLYTARPANGAGPAADPIVLGIDTWAKVVGSGREVGADILHPNGRTYDQMLLEGAAATIRADPGQVARISFVDLNDDIVQVEFTGSGTLSLRLDNASAPAAPVNYNQAISYVKGHASIVVAGADQTTHVAIFTVGSMTAVNQALFKPGTVYDGVADLAFIAIHTTNGMFGALRAGNARFYATRGAAGVYAPGVFFTRPVYVHNIAAYDNATPFFALGEGSDVRVNGGDLFQPNGRDVQVGGIARLKYMNGTDSHGYLLPARANRGRLVENGVDVTARIVEEVFILSPDAVNE